MVQGRSADRSSRRRRALQRVLGIALTTTMLLSSVAPGFAGKRPSGPAGVPVTALTAEDIETTRPSDARSSGSNRIETALAISRSSAGPYDAVVIATSANFPDALSGAPLADAANAPILLNGPAALDDAVRTRLLELKVAGAQTAYLLGGSAALSPAVESAVAAIFGAAKTERIGGTDRYDTASRIAAKLGTIRPVTGVVLASGETYPDALSAAGWAAFSGDAILLTRRDSIPAPTVASLAALGHTPATADNTGTAESGLLVVGGTGAISDLTVSAYAEATRIGGANRYETSALIAQHAWEWGMPSATVGFATGLNFPDALAAGPWCARNGAPLLLVGPSTLPTATQTYLAGHSSTVKNLRVFGGTGAVSPSVVTAAADAAVVMMSKLAPVATAETDELLSAVTSDTLVFSDENAQLEALQVGWVLRSDPTSAAPSGYFRKILAIDRHLDGSVSYETTTAALTDVMIKGSVDVVMPVGNSAVGTAAAEPRSGGSMRASSVGNETSFNSKIEFSIGPGITLDMPDGSKVAIAFTGGVSFEQTIVVSIVVDGRWKSGLFGIPYWESYVSKYEQYVSYKGSWTLNFSVSGKVDKFEQPIGPQIPMSAEPLAGFLVKPEAQLMLKGTVGVEVSGSLELKISETKTGIRYRDGHGWERIEEEPAEPSPPQWTPTAKVSGSFKLGIGAELGVSLCDFVGPYLNVTLLFGKVALSYAPLESVVTIKLDAGFSVAGGLKADVPFLGTNLAKMEIFEEEVVILGLSWDFDFANPPPPPPPTPAPTGPTMRVSTTAEGYQTSMFGAEGPSISGDGRYVAFQSAANDLVPDDPNGTDIFVKDTVTGSLLKASTNSSGTHPGWNQESTDAAISADGRHVAFVSRSSNLIADDTNNVPDVFMKDTVTGVTRCVSTDSSGVQATGDGVYGVVGSQAPALSADGRFVAFTSPAANLVADDTNGVHDIFVKDMLTGITRRASTDSGGAEVIDGYAWGAPAISADGRYVAFGSTSATLVPHDTNGVDDVFVKDMLTGITRRVSTTSLGAQSTGVDWSGAWGPSISADGRYVSYCSDANNLVSGDTNNAVDIFVKDTLTGETRRATTDANGTQVTGGFTQRHSISADGRYVVFEHSVATFVPADLNESWDIFVKDMTTGALARASTDSFGTEANAGSADPVISSDGRYVAFVSAASDLVVGDTNEHPDVFLKDMVAPAQ